MYTQCIVGPMSRKCPHVHDPAHHESNEIHHTVPRFDLGTVTYVHPSRYLLHLHRQATDGTMLEVINLTSLLWRDEGKTPSRITKKTSKKIPLNAAAARLLHLQNTYLIAATGFTGNVTSTKSPTNKTKWPSEGSSNSFVAAAAVAASLLHLQSMYTVAKRHQDPQHLELSFRARTNRTSTAENKTRVTATTQEGGQDHRDGTRQHQTQEKQRRAQQTSGQPARRDPNKPGTILHGRVNRHLRIGSRGKPSTHLSKTARTQKHKRTPSTGSKWHR